MFRVGRGGSRSGQYGGRSTHDERCLTVTQTHTENKEPVHYLRVAEDLFENPKLGMIADDQGPLTYAVWLYVLCAGKRAKCLGRVVASPVRVARMINADVARTNDIIESLIDAGALIPIDGNRAHEYQIKNWSKWQSMVPSERSKKHREKATLAVTTGMETEDDGTQNGDAVTAQGRRRRRRQGQVVQENLSEAKPSDRADIRAVFAHWSTLEAATGGTQEPELTATRIRKISARLKDGYTVEQLNAAVTGFMNDAFHLGNNDRKTRYTGIATLFKSGDKVEDGIKLRDKQAGTSSSYGYLDD